MTTVAPIRGSYVPPVTSMVITGTSPSTVAVHSANQIFHHARGERDDGGEITLRSVIGNACAGVDTAKVPNSGIAMASTRRHFVRDIPDFLLF
jgi:hypothetical protein